MSTLRDKIVDLTENKKKHFSRIIQKDPDLLQEISSSLGDTIPEKVYNYVHNNTTNICKKGNKKKFKSIIDGYICCGPMSTCECAREAVSAKISAIKQQETPEQKAAINAKRVETNTRVYGVGNTGQTEYAKSQHAKFYEEKSKSKS